ncbi:SH3 and PX-domain-containing 3 [Favolaschia claudopus]|uniref:SH3 and PX-domain-containing 3 n=1 Tax=Favolaschia claudopus TaxID=2862362 RepID=A0AAW0CJM0_9AGAR
MSIHRAWHSPRLQSSFLRLGFCGLLILGVLWCLLPGRTFVDWTPKRVEILFDSVADALGHPTFKDIRIYEKTLPQYFSPGKGTVRPRYLFFPWASWGSGWNNVFQEQDSKFMKHRLMNTHLAHLSQRAYVFPDYIPRDHPPFPDTLENGTRHMLHVPMNAFVSGPTGGGPLSVDGSDSLMRRAVSEEWWNGVCPPSEVVVVDLHKTMGELGLDGSSDAAEILGKWAAKLLAISEPCVSIEGGSVFDYILFGAKERILPVWPLYGDSPALKYFAWSPLVTAAMFQNFHLLSSTSAPKYLVRSNDIAPYHFTSFPPLRPSEAPISDLLAIHVRRGDYEYHCQFLADISADYTAWSALGTPGLSQKFHSRPLSQNSSMSSNPPWPALPDYLDVPAGVQPREAWLEHCWPSAEAIVARVGEVRDTYRSSPSPNPTLHRIYISTNGERSWIDGLTAHLKLEGWEVSTSLDMQLTQEQRAVSQAVDMGILTAAEVFIGVGFSSLTSNVVQIRLAGGRDPRTIRFW